MSDNMLSLISKVADLEFELKCFEARQRFVREYEHAAIWEYDIATRTLELQRKLDGRYAEDNKTIPNYQESMHSWNIVHPDDWNIFDAYCDSMNNGDQYFSYDFRQVVNDAMFTWVRNSGYAVYDANGIPVKVIGTTMDISDEMRIKNNLVKLAEYDSLTGLLNKQSFISNVKKYLANTANTTYGASFYIIDIDNFKTINDTKGHPFGDEIIRKVGYLLKDSVPSNNYVSRIGGDEFCMFIKGRSTEEDSLAFAESLIEKASKIELFDGLHVSLSIGISLYPLHGLEFDRLFDSADWALYYSKTKGKKQATIYHQDEKDINAIDSDSIEGFLGLISDIRSLDSTNDHIDLTSTSDKDRYTVIQQVFNALKSTYYIVNNETFEVVDYSRNIQRIIPFMNESGKLCYEKIAGRQKPCVNCPVESLVNKKCSQIHSLEYKSKFGKLLRLSALSINESETLVAIQDISRFAEVNSRFNINVGALTIQSFIAKINNAVMANKRFTVCVMSLVNIDNTENKIELIKSLIRQVNHLIQDDEYICLIHNDVIMCQLFRDRENSSIFTSSVLMSYNAYFSSEDSSNTANAYGALYLPDSNETAGVIINNALECLKEAFVRHSMDDHFYLISDRM